MAAPFHFGVFGDGLRINYTIVTLSGIILFHWKSKSWRKTLDKPMPTWKRFLLLFLCCEFTTKIDSGFTILACFSYSNFCYRWVVFVAVVFLPLFQLENCDQGRGRDTIPGRCWKLCQKSSIPGKMLLQSSHRIYDSM